MSNERLRVPTRSGVFSSLLSSGIAILAVGLTIPFVVGEPIGATPSSGPVIDAAPNTSAGTASPTPRAGTTPSATPTGRATEVAGAPPVLDPPQVAGPVGTSTEPGPTLSSPPAGPSPEPTASTAPTTPAAAPLTASDVGVTPETIQVGILVPEEIQIEGTGSSSDFVGDITDQWTVAIDTVNDAGGIGGRALEAAFREYDALDADDMRAACIYLTEQVKVFAVMNSGGYYGDPILCITEQHQTPFLGQAGEIRDFYTRSNGLYFSTTPNKDRVLLNKIQRMFDNGYFEGRTVGIVEQEGIDKIPVDNSMVPLMNQLGIEIAYRATFSEDFATAQSQTPIHVNQMRSAQVDTVLLPVGLGTASLFVAQADSQGYRPQYWTSDFASGTSDIYTIAMPDSFDGALGYSSVRTGEARAGMPEPEHDRRCREQYEAGSGRDMDRTKSEYYSTVTACGILATFATAATNAGADLTRTGLSNALQGLGSFPVPFSGAGSFAAGKFDAPDETRLVRWHSNCRCWMPEDDFARTPY